MSGRSGKRSRSSDGLLLAVVGFGQSEIPTAPFPTPPFAAEDPLDAPTHPRLRALTDTRPRVAAHDVPWLMISFSEIRRMPLDPRHGFVVSLIDGRVDVETIVDMSGMAQDDVLRLLVDLMARGVVVMR